MKLKVKKGHDLLFLPRGEFITIHDGDVIVNFSNKYTYKSFKQKDNHVLIDTEDGEVDLVFTGEVPVLEYESFCKDQLILKITEGTT